MPELPDIAIYLEALETRIQGQRLIQVRIGTPFLLRTVAPPIQSICGQTVTTLRRLGKRIVFGFENDLWLVLHLMIAGRLHWVDSGGLPGKAPAKKRAGSSASKTGELARKGALASLEFTNGTLSLTEAGTKRRASLHLVQGEA